MYEDVRVQPSPLYANQNLICKNQILNKRTTISTKNE